jgi:enoyl-CoA hydratase/carnithine racemase
MLFHCDLVYAGDNAAFSMPFVNLGLCPEAASSLLVPQMLGYHRAAEALADGRALHGRGRARGRPGQPHRATDRSQWRTPRRRPASWPPNRISSLVETKRLMKKGQAALVAQQMAEEGASFGRMLREPAAREAFGAFMEKRKPDFSRF